MTSWGSRELPRSNSNRSPSASLRSCRQLSTFCMSSFNRNFIRKSLSESCSRCPTEAQLASTGPKAGQILRRNQTSQSFWWCLGWPVTLTTCTKSRWCARYARNSKSLYFYSAGRPACRLRRERSIMWVAGVTSSMQQNISIRNSHLASAARRSVDSCISMGAAWEPRWWDCTLRTRGEIWRRSSMARACTPRSGTSRTATSFSITVMEAGRTGPLLAIQSASSGTLSWTICGSIGPTSKVKSSNEVSKTAQGSSH